jgi:hypothetical protein
MMATYRIVDGAAVPFPEAEGRPSVLLPVAPEPLSWLAPVERRTPRQRRQAARCHTRGRRGARRISAWTPAVYFAVEKPPIRLDRHQIGDGRGRVALLYLPAGEAPTAEHCAAVERAMVKP